MRRGFQLAVTAANRSFVSSLHQRSFQVSATCLCDAAASDFPIDPRVPSADEKRVYSEKVQKIADDVCHLSMLETADLIDLLKDRLGLDDGDLFLPVGGGVAAPAQGAAAPVEEVKEEKTHFNVKLTGFDAKAKIKIIKEVRASTSLGLKEAKELVEGLPAVLASDMKKEDAEAFIAKLKELGGEAELE